MYSRRFNSSPSINSASESKSRSQAFRNDDPGADYHCSFFHQSQSLNNLLAENTAARSGQGQGQEVPLDSSTTGSSTSTTFSSDHSPRPWSIYKTPDGSQDLLVKSEEAVPGIFSTNGSNRVFDPFGSHETSPSFSIVGSPSSMSPSSTQSAFDRMRMDQQDFGQVSMRPNRFPPSVLASPSVDPRALSTIQSAFEQLPTQYSRARQATPGELGSWHIPVMENEQQSRSSSFGQSRGMPAVQADPGPPSRFLKLLNVRKDMSIWVARDAFKQYGDLKGIFTTFLSSDGVIFLEFFDIRHSMTAARRLLSAQTFDDGLIVQFCSQVAMLQVSPDIMEQENEGYLMLIMTYPRLTDNDLLRVLSSYGDIQSFQSDTMSRQPSALVEYYDTRDAAKAHRILLELSQNGQIQCHVSFRQKDRSLVQGYTHNTMLGLLDHRSSINAPTALPLRHDISFDMPSSLGTLNEAESRPFVQEQPTGDVKSQPGRCETRSASPVRLQAERQMSNQEKPIASVAKLPFFSGVVTWEALRQWSDNSFSAQTTTANQGHSSPALTSGPTTQRSVTPRSLPSSPASEEVITSDCLEKIDRPDRQDRPERLERRGLGSLVGGNEPDFERIALGDDRRTTFMIRNIPNKYTQQMLLDCINETHFGKFDFLYLRMDFKNKCNVGYAFINFVNVDVVASFAQEHVGKRWSRFNSDKVCGLSYANIQGRSALIEKFRNSSVMDEDPSYRPKIFHTSGPNLGLEEPFPESNVGTPETSRGQLRRKYTLDY